MSSTFLHPQILLQSRPTAKLLTLRQKSQTPRAKDAKRAKVDRSSLAGVRPAPFRHRLRLLRQSQASSSATATPSNENGKRRRSSVNVPAAAAASDLLQGDDAVLDPSEAVPRRPSTPVQVVSAVDIGDATSYQTRAQLLSPSCLHVIPALSTCCDSRFPTLPKMPVSLVNPGQSGRGRSEPHLSLLGRKPSPILAMASSASLAQPETAASTRSRNRTPPAMLQRRLECADPDATVLAHRVKTQKVVSSWRCNESQPRATQWRLA